MGSTNKMLQPMYFLKVLIQEVCPSHLFGSSKSNDAILKEQAILSSFSRKMLYYSVKPPYNMQDLTLSLSLSQEMQMYDTRVSAITNGLYVTWAIHHSVRLGWCQSLPVR